ncbi:FAD-dependent oxidoreductase [Ponticaulis sp.]|uniref:FAD-dependent oxidoreductase n=1 Tax=Ponticaulis sp. TaxID=2020902 RepID=UPI000B64C03C|nr:FAD-dependent oxidoreductase [Ponticaulis sp.]MAI91572.1 monooxygenase [Ponticaulis sp.]OUX97527.1 MAG: monooxygenase [Hyphomonadaceae bacterium TMED5]|tara:strand:+ start:32831 stop:34012 length:1182 start_codon:yes stop_codon:yes gene_type:complete
MKIIIAGGGIAGLTAALCLSQDGHQVTILEQAPEFSEVGAGLQIGPNGMRVMQALGLEDKMRATAYEPERIELRFGQSGRVIFDIPLAERAVDRWGAPYLHIHRADLVGILETACMESDLISVKFNTRVQFVEQTSSEVRVHLPGGDEEVGDILVGADGIHSVVQEQILPPTVPRFTGNVAWRGIVRADELTEFSPPPTACAWVGRGQHAVTYYLRGGELVNFVAVVERSDWREESWSQAGPKDDLLRDFVDWDPVILNVITKGESFFRWALFDRPPLAKWVEGRVALMGDAAHPMLPFVAQGAVMAMEDAYMLAKSLRHARSVGDGLLTYQARRHARATHVQALSRKNSNTFHRRNPLMRLATYGPMWLAGHALPELVHQRMDWIYGYDVTA